MMETVDKIKDNKYNNIHYVDKYAALWSFGYLNGFGQSEGFYRAINELGFADKDKNGVYNILDVGCGVGRVVCDYAKHFRNSQVIGLDESPIMLRLANKIVKTNKRLKFNQLTNQGFVNLGINGFGVDNVKFVCDNLINYHKNNKQRFDIITCINFIDRVADLERVFGIMVKLLKESGTLILASPLNFVEFKYWNKFGSLDKLKKYFKKIDFKVEVGFDNLVYREILDTRGAYEEYKEVILKIKKI